MNFIPDPFTFINTQLQTESELEQVVGSIGI